MSDTVNVPIDELAPLWVTRCRLLDEIEERTRAIEQIDALLKEKLPDEDKVTARIDGRPAFTFSYTQRWSGKRLEEENPQLHQQYLKTVLKEVIDWERFVQDHPVLARQYQVRSLTPWRPRKIGS